ncbi:hypothetical protein LXL04_019925 [Taraxacum kok-saghyz]
MIPISKPTESVTFSVQTENSIKPIKAKYKPPNYGPTIEKARFAKLYVSTEEMRVERYIWGLKTSIREFVEIQKPGTFQSAVDAAESREWEKNRQVGDRASGKRKSEGVEDKFRLSSNGNQVHCPMLVCTYNTQVWASQRYELEVSEYLELDDMVVYGNSKGSNEEKD